jgi:tetratricopeptide (TPR) repeat protein
MISQVDRDAAVSDRVDARRELIAAACRCTRVCDEEAMRKQVAEHWSVDELVRWLHDEDASVVAAAAVCIGCLGDADLAPVLAPLLHHEDAVVAAVVERTLWGLWFRAGSTVSQERIREAVYAMHEERWDAATAGLDRIIATEPGFAEAWNQRAIARYLQGDYCRAIADCKRVMTLNPHHFGAMAGMGHCFTIIGRHAEAVECYRAALAIHPRMDGIRQSIRQLCMLIERSAAGPAVEPRSLGSPGPASVRIARSEHVA